MPRPDDNRTGARIREQRRLARVTQRELAKIPTKKGLIMTTAEGKHAGPPQDKPWTPPSPTPSPDGSRPTGK